jgi:hypothetical protein
VVFKEKQEVFNKRIPWIGRVLSQTGDKVTVFVHESFPPQVWQVSEVEVWDWMEFRKILFGY